MSYILQVQPKRLYLGLRLPPGSLATQLQAVFSFIVGIDIYTKQIYYRHVALRILCGLLDRVQRRNLALLVSESPIPRRKALSRL